MLNDQALDMLLNLFVINVNSTFIDLLGLPLSSIYEWPVLKFFLLCPTAVLTCTVGSAIKRSLVVVVTVSGKAPCSGAKRQGKVLDEVSTAVLGDAVAEND